jgi:Concanavalin A-like lectin/glucanases superfamily
MSLSSSAEPSVNATLYLNGRAIGTGPLTYNPVPGTEPLRIGTTVGGDPDGFGWSFNGSIDDVRIYERALSAIEVRSLFAEIPR